MRRLMSAMGQKLPRDLAGGAAAIPPKADTVRRVYASAPNPPYEPVTVNATALTSVPISVT
jgi:hypothetical protein